MAGVSQYEKSAIAQVQSVFSDTKSVKQSEYEVGLPLALGLLYVRVYLGSSFPNHPPRIVVASNVIHPLIGEKQIIEYPEANSWSPGISLLSIIQNIYNSFKSNPPKPAPKLPNFQQLIQNWNKSIEDEQDLLEFVMNLDEPDRLLKIRDQLLEGNLAKVNENLARKNEYDSMVNEHQGEINEIENLTGQLGNLMKQVEVLNKQYSQEKVLEKLKEMEARYNKEAGDILKRFMKKEIDMDEFVEQYQVPVKRAKFIQIARETRG
ncbi:hypothetical protein SteCoe_13012 [Stentor coeruleus]|uniref:VPS37 C-terminal domain-containing protein n=1 Tax=Stentor coeruleus TaxID=5963 RepID=A0A1R2C9G8_9CILI|nr:hypothetical protein SteCoe_13012 [Stentor coeruleus]